MPGCRSGIFKMGHSVASNYRIAIVEDDESLRLALVSLMRCVGHEATSFESAEQFLAADGASDSDCVITDINLQGLSGIELTERLRAAGHNVPVIAMTARSDAGLEQKALASGADCFLKKPFEMDQLVACIDSVLSTGER